MLSMPAFGFLCALHYTDRKTEPQGQEQGSLLSDSLEERDGSVIYKSLEPLSLAVIFPIGELFSVEAYVGDPSTYNTEVGGLSWVQGQPGCSTEFKNSLGTK